MRSKKTDTGLQLKKKRVLYKDKTLSLYEIFFSFRKINQTLSQKLGRPSKKDVRYYRSVFSRAHPWRDSFIFHKRERI